MPVTNEFLSANETYASRFSKGELPLPPARRWPSSCAWTRASIQHVLSGWRKVTHTSFEMPVAAFRTLA